MKKFFVLLKRKGFYFMKDMILISTIFILIFSIFWYTYYLTDMSESFGINIALTVLLSIHTGREYLDVLLRKLRKVYFNLLGVLYK